MLALTENPPQSQARRSDGAKAGAERGVLSSYVRDAEAFKDHAGVAFL